MKTKLLSLALALLSLPAFAQIYTVPNVNGPNTWTGQNTFPGIIVNGVTVSLLGTAFSSWPAGTLAVVTDSLSGSCTAGGGTTKQWCRFNGSSWDPVGGSGAGVFLKGLSFILTNPQAADTGKYQYDFFNPVSVLQEIDCSTDTGTVGINFDLRSITSSNTAGPQALSSTFVCDASGETNTQFAVSSINANQILVLHVVSVTGTPGVVRVHVKYQ